MTPASPPEDIVEGYNLLTTGAGVVRVNRDVVRVGGPDALRYLQGQLSQDLEPLSVGGVVYGFILEPRGYVDAVVRVGRTGDDEFVLLVDGGWGEATAERLKRFQIRTKATIEVLCMHVAAVGGRGAEDLVGALRGEPGAHGDAARAVAEPQAVDAEPASWSGAIVSLGDRQTAIPWAWPGLAGYDLIGTAPPDEPIAALVADLPACAPEAWEAVRIEAGMPVMGREIGPRTLPAAIGITGLAVSFTKGCYVGQELVARVDARGGRVPERLVRIDMPVPEDGVSAASGSGGALRPVRRGTGVAGWGRGAEAGMLAEALADAPLHYGDVPCGRITSAAWSPGTGGIVCLAYLARSVPASAELTAGDNPGFPAVVSALGH